MAIETHVHDGGAWRKAKQIHVHDGTAWRDLKEAWCHDGSTWRKVFAKGYWRKTGGSIANITSTWSVNLFAIYNDEFYVFARDSYGYGFVNAGLYKWSGTTWDLQGSLISINAAAPISMIAHTDGIHVFYSGMSWGHDIWDGSSWSAATSPYVTPVDGITVGTTLYIADSYDAGGGCCQYWTGSAWATLGSNLYECRCLAKVGTQLYALGCNVSGGAYYDWEVLRWTGTTWSALTRASGTSYYETNMLIGDDAAVYAAVDSGYLVQSNGTTMERLTGDPLQGSYFIGNRYANADGKAVLPISSPGYYYARVNAGALKPFSTEVYMGYYAGMFWTSTSRLYVVVRGSYTGDPVDVWVWEGELPE
jgi:hypothetical protein